MLTIKFGSTAVLLKVNEMSRELVAIIILPKSYACCRVDPPPPPPPKDVQLDEALLKTKRLLLELSSQREPPPRAVSPEQLALLIVRICPPDKSTARIYAGPVFWIWGFLHIMNLAIRIISNDLCQRIQAPYCSHLSPSEDLQSAMIESNSY